MITYIKSSFHICENGKKKVTELSVVRFYEKGVIKIHLLCPLASKIQREVAPSIDHFMRKDSMVIF